MRASALTKGGIRRKVGEDRKALVEAERKQLGAAQERVHAVQREIEDLVIRGAVTNRKVTNRPSLWQPQTENSLRLPYI